MLMNLRKYNVGLNFKEFFSSDIGDWIVYKHMLIAMKCNYKKTMTKMSIEQRYIKERRRQTNMQIFKHVYRKKAIMQFGRNFLLTLWFNIEAKILSVMDERTDGFTKGHS